MVAAAEQDFTCSHFPFRKIRVSWCATGHKVDLRPLLNILSASDHYSLDTHSIISTRTMDSQQSKPSTAESGMFELSADNQYQYSPLRDTDDSRLLHIQPGRKHDRIECTLSPLSFASKPA